MPAGQRWHKTDPEFEKFLAALPPLHRAAATGDISKLDVLLNSGESCDDVDWEVSNSLYRHDQTGWDFTSAPPVHFAAYYGHTQAVLFLLTKGAAIDAKDAAGTTALHAAAWTGNEELFQNLLRKGADSSICDYDGWSVTVYAMSQGHVSILHLLLENSDGDAEMLVKRYKARHAAKLGHQDNVLAMLLEDQATGEDEKAREMLFAEALAGAAEGGHVELVQKLLDCDADPTVPDSSGSTALHWAAWGGHAEAGNMMRDEKSNVEKNETAEMGTYSQLSLTSGCHESVIQLLLEKGATIDAQNCQGCTPLHWVSGAGSTQMIQCLLDHDADVTVVDKFGRTAIDRAVETGDALVIEQLQSELLPFFSPSTEHFANEVGTQQKVWYF
jgi:ankyrin repeat protein